MGCTHVGWSVAPSRFPFCPILPFLPHLPRYLFTEWEDPVFGTRASAIHQSLVATLQKSGKQGDRVWEAIRRQTDMVSQLNYVSREIKSNKVGVLTSV